MSPELGQPRFASLNLALAGGIALLCLSWGAMIAFADLNALYLALSLIGCGFILFDFRAGVVLLLLLLPVSRSYVFPHAMLGITGLNPFNLLLAATLGSFMVQAMGGGGLRRFLPRPLLWLYLAPICAAGLAGLQHLGDIAPAFFMYGMLDFKDAPGYLREMLLKPMQLVLFALLLGAAVAKSAQPARFLVPTLLSIWLAGALVIVFVAFSGVGLGVLASSSSRGFLSALGLHANDLGRLYVFAYALLLFTWAESADAGLRLSLLATMLLVVTALVLTFSRGAFFGFLVVNALFLLWRGSLRTLLIVALVAGVVLLMLPGAVYERAATGFGKGLNAVSAGRVDGIWLPLLPDLLRNPVFGNGLGAILWSDAMRKTDGITIVGTTHPHNAYLQVLLDMGVAGLFLIGAYFVHVWKGFRSLGADDRIGATMRGFYQGAAAGLISYLLAAVTDSRLTPVPEQAFLWLAIGLMYGERQRLERAGGPGS